MPVIDDIKESQKSIKDKGFKYKLSYYVGYYKVPALIIIGVCIIAFSLIKHIVTAKDLAYETAFINAIGAPDEQKFAEKIGVDTEKYDVYFDYSYMISADSDTYNEASYTNSTKLMAVIAAATVDTVVGDSTIMTSYFNAEIFADLRDYFTEEELTALGDKVIWHQPVDALTGEVLAEAYPMAIEVGDSKVLSDVPCFYTDSVYFAIVVNTKHPEDARAFYDYLYE